MDILVCRLGMGGTSKTRDARGSLFRFGARRGGAEEKNFVFGRGGVTVKLRAFSGWGGPCIPVQNRWIFREVPNGL